MPQFWDLGLKTGIWASRLGFGPKYWDLGLEAGIWASRLINGHGGGVGGVENSPVLCESIGHRALRGRCPKRVEIIEKGF